METRDYPTRVVRRWSTSSEKNVTHTASQTQRVFNKGQTISEKRTNGRMEKKTSSTKKKIYKTRGTCTFCKKKTPVFDSQIPSNTVFCTPPSHSSHRKMAVFRHHKWSGCYGSRVEGQRTYSHF